jgi:hypothetical protein
MARQQHAQAEAEARTRYKALCRATRASAAADHNAYVQDCAANISELHQQRRMHEAFKLADTLAGRRQRAELTSLMTAQGMQHGAAAVEAMAQHMHRVLNVPSVVDPAALMALATARLGPGAGEVWGLTPEQALAIARAAVPQLAGEGGEGPAAQTAQARTRAERAAAAAASQGEGPGPGVAWPADDSEPTLEEVQAAAGRLRNLSAPGEEGVSPFLLKCPEVVAWMHRVIIATWRGGRAPDSWRHALLVALWKGKGTRLLGDNYRGVTLISLTSKVYVHLLHQRIREHLLAGLHEAQCGFRPGRGTGDQLFSMRRVQELARAHQAPLHAAFVDFSKAFDCVNRTALWALLAARGVHPKLLALIQDLYSGNSAAVAVGGVRSQPFPMSTGVRQGCPLSPLLFCVWMDFLCRQVAAACESLGVRGYRVAYRIDGRLVEPPRCDREAQLLMLLFADDVVLLGPDAGSLHVALLAMERTASTWGMQLSYAKTKVMVCAPDRAWAEATAAAEAAASAGSAGRAQGEGPVPAPAPAVGAAAGGGHPACSLAGGNLELVSCFKYLGGIAEASGSQERELNHRLQVAGHAFKQFLPRVFRSRRVGLRTKVMLYRVAVLSVLLYGAAESWALTDSQLHRLCVFHTTCLRRIMGVSRLDRVTNEELFARSGIPCVSQLLRSYRLRWGGHLARCHDGRWAKQLLFAHEVPGGTRRVGRPNVVWADSFRADVAAKGPLLQGREWYTVAQNRVAWRAIANG